MTEDQVLDAYERAGYIVTLPGFQLSEQEREAGLRVEFYAEIAGQQHPIPMSKLVKQP